MMKSRASGYLLNLFEIEGCLRLGPILVRLLVSHALGTAYHLSHSFVLNRLKYNDLLLKKEKKKEDKNCKNCMMVFILQKQKC